MITAIFPPATIWSLHHFFLIFHNLFRIDPLGNLDYGCPSEKSSKALYRHVATGSTDSVLALLPGRGRPPRTAGARRCNRRLPRRPVSPAGPPVLWRKMPPVTKTEYRQYIASPLWRERRKAFLEENGLACNRCDVPRWLAAIAYDQDLHVHHLHYATLGAETDEDLEALCRRCHELETFGRSSLPKIPSAKCEFCAETHWNLREDFCERCLCVLELAGKYISEYLFDESPITGQPVWISILRGIYCALRNTDEIVQFQEKIDLFESWDVAIENLHASPTDDEPVPF